jgi:N-ethylmaleimide reductase
MIFTDPPQNGLVGRKRQAVIVNSPNMMFFIPFIGFIKVLYIHLVDHSSMGAPVVSAELINTIRERFHGTIILSGGYTKERADAEVLSGRADLISFGRPFINNPDLVRRFEYGWTLSQQLDMNTLYTSGEKGYTDYPNHSL